MADEIDPFPNRPRVRADLSKDGETYRCPRCGHRSVYERGVVETMPLVLKWGMPVNCAKCNKKFQLVVQRAGQA